MSKIDYAKISSDNVRFLLLKNNLSIRYLAENIDIAPTTLNDALKSKKGIAIDSLIKIADFFNITVNDLCNADFAEYNIIDNKDEYKMIFNKYCLLDKHGRDIVSLIIDKELDRIMNNDI